ncbi:uncharacterized protein F5147DRAFT_779706 [Suillus discolor]|uniref:PCI domain-containing protein n=1 Tax=Suillus discolor TaxID=1912936 RepID=A0A9P7EUU2_9AGAM|nr:uncharacterized protein F5147DRAFT_779706 [Suillus discolor]KAG2092311.1 hypothetical protein F5147DRAFT_779706 [Suillus discolor]
MPHSALLELAIRQFMTGGVRLLDALSTFTATELTTYNDFVTLTIIPSPSNDSLPHQKLSVLPEVPILGDLLDNLYDFATLEQTHLLPLRLLSPHTRYYVREMRILAYSQLLESYRSLTLESLSGAFGVSVEFVDRHVLSARVFVHGPQYALTLFLQKALHPLACLMSGPLSMASGCHRTYWANGTSTETTGCASR